MGAAHVARAQTVPPCAADTQPLEKFAGLFLPASRHRHTPGVKTPMTNTVRASNQAGMAPWLNWIEQPPPKGQVAGSNPAGVTKLLFKIK